MSPETKRKESFLNECEGIMRDLYGDCLKNAPNFGVQEECFKTSLRKSLIKYVIKPDEEFPTLEEAEGFLRSIQADDLFMALGCANGNERAWWEFDQQHRTYLERISRHLASTDLNAREVVDLVYVELYGTRVVDGERVSKFGTYSGKGSIRGWLRTVIWHSLVDLHRASHDEVSLDEMTENVGEGHAQSTFAEPNPGGETEMIDDLAKARFRNATVIAIESAFSSLDDHEKLLLLYYHVENLKLREIARLVEVPTSPLRNWFQRKSAARERDPKSRIHESTIMRWLEKTYSKVLHKFSGELKETHNLKEQEIEICMDLATQDLANPNLYKNLATGKD
jgi:RNA polymerase sigma-70 factor